MPAPSEDADGAPLRPVALAIGALFASVASAPVHAQAFDPGSTEVLQAYSAPLTAPKQGAARAGLNVLLPNLLAFPDLVPSVHSTGASFVIVSGSLDSFHLTIVGGGGASSYSDTFFASSDADLAALGTPVVLSDAILQLGASFATARDFVIGPSPALIDTNGSDLLISGTLTANATLTKSGAGTLALSGANVWFAAPVVEAGTLKGQAASLQTPITNDATVEFAQAADQIYGFVIEGSGAVRKTGAGTLTLSGANAYAGATFIEQGRLALISAGRLGAGPGFDRCGGNPRLERSRRRARHRHAERRRRDRTWRLPVRDRLRYGQCLRRRHLGSRTLRQGRRGQAHAYRTPYLYRGHARHRGHARARRRGAAACANGAAHERRDHVRLERCRRRSDARLAGRRRDRRARRQCAHRRNKRHGYRLPRDGARIGRLGQGWHRYVGVDRRDAAQWHDGMLHRARCSCARAASVPRW
jgi:autotransporter-associated beta strand protein